MAQSLPFCLHWSRSVDNCVPDKALQYVLNVLFLSHLKRSEARDAAMP